jgi:hypothetical protein
MKGKRRLLLVVASMAVVVAIAVTVLLTQANHHPRAKVSAHPTSSATVSPMPSADAQRIDNALSSTDLSVQASAWAKEISSGYVKQGKYAWPKGTTVKIDPKTFVVSSTGLSAIVLAQTSTSGSYVFHLVKENGQWLVLFTEPLR